MKNCTVVNNDNRLKVTSLKKVDCNLGRASVQSDPEVKNRINRKARSHTEMRVSRSIRDSILRLSWVRRDFHYTERTVKK
jgi:hypothetical protein